MFPYTYKTSLPRCKQTIFFCLSPLMVSFVILVSVRWIIRCVCHCHSIKWYECVRLPRLTGCKAGNRKLLQIKMRNVNELNWRKKNNQRTPTTMTHQRMDEIETEEEREKKKYPCNVVIQVLSHSLTNLAKEIFITLHCIERVVWWNRFGLLLPLSHLVTRTFLSVFRSFVHSFVRLLARSATLAIRALCY